MSGNQINPELLKRYLLGDCNSEEVSQVEGWYASIDKDSTNTEPFDQQAHLKSIQEKISIKIKTYREDRQVKRLWPIFKQYAAAVIVIGLCGMIFYLYKSGYSLNRIQENTALTRITNTHRQVRKHFLPDGSMVWLNPGAVISYAPESFSTKTREVSVSGEAFLDVTKDASRPFLVNTGGLIVRVLGTSFNVKAFTRQRKYEVSVVSGKVQVFTSYKNDRKKYVLLLPSQKAVFQGNTGILTATQVIPANHKAESWQPVSLTFDDENLGEVVKRLEAKFGISIQLADTDLNNCLLKATFENNRLSEILETTTQMLGASYEMNGDSIVIRGNGCEPETDRL